jgi:uncharacterized protein (TIGR02265 family)
MIQAHLAWAKDRLGDPLPRLAPLLSGELARILERGVLATDWFLLSHLVATDRAIATAAGGAADEVFRELGRQSAVRNLGGVYKTFLADEPHRFFEQMAVLHARFQNFGRSRYQKTSPRSGRIRAEDYPEYSPVFCASGTGYYEGALKMMRVPGPLQVTESSCQCAGDPACVFELAW